MSYECLVEGGAVLTQDFGPTDFDLEPICGGSHFHSGLDLAAPCGRYVYSDCDGEVVQVGGDPGYGPYAVFVESGDVVTLYGHVQRALVSVGDHVTAGWDGGQPIAVLGTLGNSTGCHVHYSVRPAGNRLTECGSLDPHPYVCSCPGGQASPSPSPGPTPASAPPPPIFLGNPPGGHRAAELSILALAASLAGAAYWHHRKTGTPITPAALLQDVREGAVEVEHLARRELVALEAAGQRALRALRP